MTHSEAGKGDRYRPVDQKKYAEGWERVFGKKSCKHSHCIRIRRLHRPMWMCVTCKQILENGNGR